MKNLKIILSFAVVMAVVVTSCKKEIPDLVSYEDEMTVHSKNVLSLIKNFDDKLESNLKTGELITIDSAVWYNLMCTTMNSILFQLPLLNGGCTFFTIN